MKNRPDYLRSPNNINWKLLSIFEVGLISALLSGCQTTPLTSTLPKNLPIPITETYTQAPFSSLYSPTPFSTPTAIKTVKPFNLTELAQFEKEQKRPLAIKGTATAWAENPAEKQLELSAFPEYYRKSVFQLAYDARGFDGTQNEAPLLSTATLLEIGTNKKGETIALFVGVDPAMHRDDNSQAFSFNPHITFKTLSDFNYQATFLHHADIISCQSIFNQDETKSGAAFWVMNLSVENGGPGDLEPAGINSLSGKINYDSTYGGIGFPASDIYGGFMTQIENFDEQIKGQPYAPNMTKIVALVDGGMSGTSFVETGKGEKGKMTAMVMSKDPDAKTSYMLVYPPDIQEQAETIWAESQK